LIQFHQKKIILEFISQLKSDFPKIRKLNIEQISASVKDEDALNYIQNHEWINEMNELNIYELANKIKSI
jgi:hypothetical protein